MLNSKYFYYYTRFAHEHTFNSSKGKAVGIYRARQNHKPPAKVMSMHTRFSIGDSRHERVALGGRRGIAGCTILPMVTCSTFRCGECCQPHVQGFYLITVVSVTVGVFSRCSWSGIFHERIYVLPFRRSSPRFRLVMDWEI